MRAHRGGQIPAVLATLLVLPACGDGITDPPPGEATTLVISVHSLSMPRQHGGGGDLLDLRPVGRERHATRTVGATKEGGRHG